MKHCGIEHRDDDGDEAEPRRLLDPVDDKRNLIETLISPGVDQDEAVKKVPEVYSPPRVTMAALCRPDLNIKGPRAVELTINHP